MPRGGNPRAWPPCRRRQRTWGGEPFGRHGPHLHALVADGLLDDEGRFHPAPEIPVRALEKTFRTRVLAELLKHRLISPELVERMKSRKHTGFNAHLGPRVPPENRAEREQLCQYVLRNPFSVAKMTLESPRDTVIYRSRLNPKIHRNFEVFAPVDFLATIVQHIPDKGAQMVQFHFPPPAARDWLAKNPSCRPVLPEKSRPLS